MTATMRIMVGVALCAACSAALFGAGAGIAGVLVVGIPLGLVVTRLVFE